MEIIATGIYRPDEFSVTQPTVSNTVKALKRTQYIGSYQGQSSTG